MDNYINTRNLKLVDKICSDTQENKMLSVILGDSGLGKTFGTKMYKIQNENVYYCYVGRSMSPRDFYIAILKALGVKNVDQKARLHILINKVIETLNSLSDRNLLIIDEAGKFSANMIMYMHELRDQTSETTGIILGTPDHFKRDLESWVSKNLTGMPEFYTRVDMWHKLLLPNFEEVKAFCNMFGVTDIAIIKKMFSDYKDFRTLIRKLKEYLYKLNGKNIIS